MKRNPLEKPILIVIAGPNGSGKTSIAEQILGHHWYKDCIFINPDEIALTMFGDWNSHDAVLESAQYAERVREEYLWKQQSLAFEMVPLSKKNMRKGISRTVFLFAFFIGTYSSTINVNRVGQRVAEGGHSVPLQNFFPDTTSP